MSSYPLFDTALQALLDEQLTTPKLEPDYMEEVGHWLTQMNGKIVSIDFVGRFDPADRLC